MSIFFVTHRIAGVNRTNKVSVKATTPKEAHDEIATAIAGDYHGVTPRDVEIVGVVSAESDKGNGKGQKPDGWAQLAPGWCQSTRNRSRDR